MSMRQLLGDTALSGAFGGGTVTSLPLSAGGGVSDVLLAVHVTAVSGTSPALAVTLEQSLDGTTWTAVPGSAAPTLTAAGNVISNARITQNYARVAATVTGTTPSVTCRVAVLVFAE